MLLESYTIKTKLHDHINFHEIISIRFRTWNSIFTYWEHILKLCIDYIKQFMKPHQSEKDWYGYCEFKGQHHILFNVMLPFEFKYVSVSIGRTQTFNFHIWWLKGHDIWKGFDMKLLSWRPYHRFCKNLLISDPISNHWKKQNCHLHSPFAFNSENNYNLTFSFSKNSCLSNDDKGFKHDIKSILNDIQVVIQKRTCHQNNLILISH